jgi:hypothetical protein
MKSVARTRKDLEESKCGKILVRFWKLAGITERHRVIISLDRKWPL